MQARINAHALVEDKTFSVVVGAATFLEVFENTTIQLKDRFKPLALHEGPRFLAADAPGTEHDDRLLLHPIRELADGIGKLPEVVNIERHGPLECPQFDFVVVASIEKRHGSPFIEPLLEFARREFRRGTPNRIDSLNAK